MCDISLEDIVPGFYCAYCTMVEVTVKDTYCDDCVDSIVKYLYNADLKEQTMDFCTDYLRYTVHLRYGSFTFSDFSHFLCVIEESCDNGSYRGYSLTRVEPTLTEQIEMAFNGELKQEDIDYSLSAEYVWKSF